MTFRYMGLAALTARAMSALEKAVNESANDLVSRAQAETPVEEGTLQGSIQTDGAEVKGRTVEAKVYTGAESSAYAAVQHERTDFAHPRGGNAKYIEAPLIEGKPLYREAMRRAARGKF